jgi:sarcosine oxidase subunit alpha
LLADRRQLVGLEALDGSGVLAVGAHVLPSGKDEGSDGWVTSAAMSPTLRKPVALGLVRQGRSRIGESVRVWDVGAVREARIVAPAFYDPAGERLNG